jgi:hypothetical protein
MLLALALLNDGSMPCYDVETWLTVGSWEEDLSFFILLFCLL